MCTRPRLSVRASGDRLSSPLQNGAHGTRSAVLPRAFTSATFQHRWTRGAAKLTGLSTVSTDKQLA